MRYKEEYLTTNSRAEFVKLLLSKYEIKEATAIRRFYDLRKKYGKQYFEGGKYLQEEKEEPSYIKQLNLEEMKRMKYKLTRDLLRTYGFNPQEINWLIDKGEDIKDE